MKTLTQTIKAVTALAAVLTFGMLPATFAATYYLDQNGPVAGLWDGVTTPIGADLTTTTNWSLTGAGTATTTIFSAANNFQFGNTASDFNGATITITNNFNGSMGGNPAAVLIVSTNVTVNWLGTSVNQRFNHATTITVASGSTLNFSGNNYNWNNQTYTLAGGGTINFSSVLGQNDSTSGGGFIMNMIGGKLLLNQTTIGTFGSGTTGTGTGFMLTNGTLDFVSAQSFASVFGAFASIQTVKLNGGAMDNLSGAPGTINLNSGSYSVGGNFAYLGSSQSMSLGSAPVALTGTRQITVNANTLNIDGVISDGGNVYGLTKVGNGTLALTGANTYTGPTVVNAGTLSVSTIAAGAGAYTNADGATLSVKVATIGQSLAMSGLTLGTSSGSTLQFDVGLLGNPTIAPINLGAGALTVNGTANPISFSSLSAIPNYPVTIPLITYGSASGNLSSFTLGSFPASTPPYSGYVSNDVASSTVYLVLTGGLVSALPAAPKTVTWAGVITGNWNTTTANWTSSGVATNYSNLTTSGYGDLAVFDDTLTGTANVNLTTTLLPTSVAFNNNNSNYVFSGTGRISGIASLTASGSGSLTIDNSGNNDFSGGLLINSGTIQVGNNDANGSLGSASVTNNGALVISRSDSAFTVSALYGTGTVTNNGSGTVTFSGVLPFSGSVVANAGIIALSGPNSNPSTLSACTNLIINSGGTVQFNSDNVIGTAAPGVPITINAGGVLTGLATADGGQGTSSHIHNLLTLYGGTLAMAGSAGLQTSHGTWDLDGGVTVPGVPATSVISALCVVPSQIGGTIFNVTNGATSGVDLFVSGTLINGTSTHDTGVVKNGPGVMVLDNNNTYAAGTTLNGGTLQLGTAGDAAALASPLGAGTVTINTGTILNFASSKGVTSTNVLADDYSGNTLLLISSGTNTLTGASTYSGKTIVNAGATLALKNSGSLNGSSAIIVSNATFDVSTGDLVNNPAGSLALTGSTFNLGTNLVVSLGSLAISNTTLIFPLNSATPNLATASLAVGGTTNVINITAIPGQPVYPTNITLIKYSTASPGLTDANNRLTTLGLILPAFGNPSGYLTNNMANGSIDLVVQGSTLLPIYPITWNGRVGGVNNGNWDIASTPDWVLTSDGTTPYNYQDTSVVLFDDTAAGTTAVNLTTTVLPGSLTVNNTNKNYSFTGAGKISGPTGLTQNGAGTATFAETGGDNFSGGVLVNNGTLVLSNANASISGGLTVNAGLLTIQHSGTIAGDLTVNGGTALLDQAGTITGNTLINSGFVQIGNNDASGSLPSGAITDNGGLVFNRSDSAFGLATVIAGAGAVTNNGSGTVALSVAETYTGPTVVNNGTLNLSGPNAANSGIYRSSSLTINGGTVSVAVSDNGLTGSGAANIVPVFINAGGTLTGYAGNSTHIRGLVTLNGGALTVAGIGSQPQGTQAANGCWDLDGGVAVGNPVASITSIISAKYVVPSQPGGTTFNLTAGTTPSGIDLNVTGTLVNGTSVHDTGIILTGNGVMALANNNTYALGTTINGGTLQLGTANDTVALTSPLGTGIVTIYNSGSVLKFASSLGVTVSNIISDDNLADALVLVTSGTNILTAASTYTAPTVISNGVLVINGSLASASSVTVVKGMLAGNGTVGGEVTNNATMTPGTTTAIGTLTCSSDVLNNSTSTNLVKLNRSTSPSNDVLNVTGNLTYGGTLKVVNLGGAYVVGDSFKVFNVTGTTTGSFSATNFPSLGGGLGLSWNPATGTLTVIQTVNTDPATANFKVMNSNGSLQFSWAPDHVGWQLYTNAISLTAAGNWFPVPGSGSVTNAAIAIDPTKPNVFFQLRYP